MLTNISLDHKEMAELRSLFAPFPQCARARRCSTSTIPRARALADIVPADKCIGYGFDSPGAGLHGQGLEAAARRRQFAVEAEGERHEVAA